MRSINHLLEHLKKSVETGEPFFPQEHDIEMLERYTNTSTDQISRADAIEAVKFLPPYREYWKGTRKVLYTKEDIIKELKALPSADRPHGEWQKVEEQPYFRKHYDTVCCSVCRKKGNRKWNYCPNCGAKMDGNTDKPNGFTADEWYRDTFKGEDE